MGVLRIFAGMEVSPRVLLCSHCSPRTVRLWPLCPSWAPHAHSTAQATGSRSEIAHSVQYSLFWNGKRLKGSDFRSNCQNDVLNNASKNVPIDTTVLHRPGAIVCYRTDRFRIWSAFPRACWSCQHESLLGCKNEDAGTHSHLIFQAEIFFLRLGCPCELGEGL